MKKTSKKQKHIESHYLAIILIVFLLLEGYLFSSTQFSDWQKGIEILDMSTSVSEVIVDFTTVFAPLIDNISSISRFYELATTEMINLLEPNENDFFNQIVFINEGVNEFYEQATIEMSGLLDLSNTNNWIGNIAGANIIN